MSSVECVEGILAVQKELLRLGEMKLQSSNSDSLHNGSIAPLLDMLVKRLNLVNVVQNVFKKTRYAFISSN
jgi:hypothetical protein